MDFYYSLFQRNMIIFPREKEEKNFSHNFDNFKYLFADNIYEYSTIY